MPPDSLLEVAENRVIQTSAAGPGLMGIVTCNGVDEKSGVPKDPISISDIELANCTAPRLRSDHCDVANTGQSFEEPREALFGIFLHASNSSPSAC